MIPDDDHLDESTRKGIEFALWRRLWSFTRPYRVDVALLCAAAVGTAAVDALLPLVTGRLIDHVVTRGADAVLTPYAVLYGALALILCFCIWSFIRLGGRIRTHVSHDIRQAGFERLQQLSFSFFDRRPVGWLMARMTSDCERLSHILAWGVLDFVWGGTVLLAISAAMFVLNPGLAIAVVTVLPVLAWVSAVFRRRILHSARAVRKTNSKITAAYNESIMGVRTTKVFAREEENLDEFGGLTGEMYRFSVRNALQSAVYLPLVMTLGSLATGLALGFGGVKVVAGALTIGTLIVFVDYSRRFFEPIHEMAHWFAELQMAQASAERILGLIDTQPEIRDAPEVVAAMASATPGVGLAADGYMDRIERIDFRDVGFAYVEGQSVLEHFDLTVRAGETIALVGPTGGGKTTIVNLLCRFYEPTAGTILLDGIDYRQRSLAWLQSSLGIVLQSPHLFSGSIADNIRYGDLGAGDEDVQQSARLAGAHDFITAMEKGYATEVGEGGARLSTGQKQLVSFARAILARPRLLVMDEATSSVDTETEKRIQQGLERLLADRTSFVIAHRLSTIRSADRILVVEGGRIVEQGSHAELMRAHGRYQELYAKQSLRDVWSDGDAWEPQPAV